MSVNKFRSPVSSDTLSDIDVSKRLSRTSNSQLPKEKLCSLYNGESISKSNRVLAAIGSIDELISCIGIIKTEHLEEKSEVDNSSKLFLYARLTQIQETLIDIQASIGTTRKILSKYEYTRFNNAEQRIKELENEIDLMKDVNMTQIKDSGKEKPLQYIPGSSVLEAKLFYVRSLCRRAERQLCNLRIGIIPEDNCGNYLNKLGDYLLALSIHVLHIQNKEPMKKADRSSGKIFQSNLK